MSIKVYQEKPESEELFLRLTQGCERARLRIVNPYGELAPRGSLLQLTNDGVRLSGNIDPARAARAGLTNAIDANGRLKVIGQEVEAERMQFATYPAASQHGTGDLTIHGNPDGCVSFKARTGRNTSVEVTTIPIDSLRDLRDRINRHLAYLEQEGLA